MPHWLIVEALCGATYQVMGGFPLRFFEARLTRSRTVDHETALPLPASIAAIFLNTAVSDKSGFRDFIPLNRSSQGSSELPAGFRPPVLPCAPPKACASRSYTGSNISSAVIPGWAASRISRKIQTRRECCSDALTTGSRCAFARCSSSLTDAFCRGDSFNAATAAAGSFSKSASHSAE